MDDDIIEPKTEQQQSVPPKTEPTDDELLPPDPETAVVITLADGQPTSTTIEEFSDGAVQQSCDTKDSVVTCNAQSTTTTISERSWDSAASLNTEIVIHGVQVSNSTSADTVIDSNDIEFKPPPTEEMQKSDENSNPKFDYVFCVAVIHKTTQNCSKLLAISKIDTNIKVDVKSDGSSLNGYAADRSGSSSNSIIGQIDEPFLVPKAPQESFMSLSSSSSSNGVLLNQPKLKSNNILLSNNVYIYPDHLICHKCNHVYPGLSDHSKDIKDFKSESQSKTCMEKLRSKKKSNLSNTNNDCSSKKSLKKKQKTENIFEEPNVKTEVQNKNLEIDPIKTSINDSISFDIGHKVLAYWVADKLFYPAIIIDIVSPKYKVEFLSDNYVKQINIEGLVHCDALKKGSAIAIFDTVSQEYRVGEIVSINEVPNSEELTYTIDLDSEEVVVPFDKLVLDIEKARMLQDKNAIKNYDRLSMSNVSEGKRLRLSRSTSTKSVNNATKTIGSNKRKKSKQGEEMNKKRICLFPTEPDPRDIPSTSTGITRNDFDVAVLLNSSDSEFDHIREDLTTVNMNQLKNSDIDSEHSSPDKNLQSVTKEPLVTKSIKVFKDLHFVLSYAKYKRIPMLDSDQGSDNEFSLQSEYFKPHKMFKKNLSNLIVKHGGTAHRYLNLIPKSCYKYTYMITDTPSQTCNFFLSLSLGVPSYHHKYIEQAVSQRIPFPEFLANNNIQPLPNGWAVEKKAIVFRSPTTVHSTIFANYIIYLALSEEPKREFFAGLLRFCGAIVYTSWKGVSMPLSRHITVIVTDENCPANIAREKVPKLSILWVIQGLICESARPIDGHESYIAINDVISD